MKQPTGTTGTGMAAAAAETLGRIRKDREKVEVRLRPLLAHIEENLFDDKLTASSLKRHCGVRDNSLSVRFTSALGKPPYAYIQQRRMETACQLLANTGLAVWRIAELVGYSTLPIFSRAFRRWAGVRPTVYRRVAATRIVKADDSQGKKQVETKAMKSLPPDGLPSNLETHGKEIQKWPNIERWPDVGEVPCHRLELWVPADLHSELEIALAWCNTVPVDGERRLTERDLMVAALVDWLQAVTPADERSCPGMGC